jgi:8-oxo-dGTP diphosphatase
MPDRSSSARAAVRGLTLGVDVVLLTPRGSGIAVLLTPMAAGRGRPKDRWSLPGELLLTEESLDDAASRIAREALGVTPSFLEQAGAFGGGRRQPTGTPAQVSVAYFGLVPESVAGVRQGAEWMSVSELPVLGSRQREEIDASVAGMRARVDQRPIAFRLLPPAFTLSELQAIYELLLGRRLHKASFRRSLHASALVEATDEWRSEGRGRPAQLFRYSPPRRRRQHRGVRFDLLA